MKPFISVATYLRLLLRIPVSGSRKQSSFFFPPQDRQIPYIFLKEKIKNYIYIKEVNCYDVVCFSNNSNILI